MWYLGRFWYAVLHGLNPFTTGTLNYPIGLYVMSNTALISEAIFFGWLRYFTNVTFVYKAVTILNTFSVAFLGYLILPEFKLPCWMALGGGLLMTISPYLSAQLLGHANLVIVSSLVALAYLVSRFVLRRNAACPVWLGIFMGCNMGLRVLHISPGL